jgi:hypothetical protein
MAQRTIAGDEVERRTDPSLEASTNALRNRLERGSGALPGSEFAKAIPTSFIPSSRVAASTRFRHASAAAFIRTRALRWLAMPGAAVCANAFSKSSPLARP